MTKGSSGNGNSQANPVFTLDPSAGESVEIPSVTRLLNRKKLGLSSPSEAEMQPAPEPAAVTAASSEPPPIPTKWNINRTQAKTAIQRVSGRTKKILKIAHWKMETLRSARDPFQKAVWYLIQKGASQALLLTPPSTVMDSNAPVQFDALCAYRMEDKKELWCGLSLTPVVAPEIWDQLFTVGLYEVTPSLSAANESVAFLKKAFGLSVTEYLTLIRCGAPNACTGILALVSTSSLKKEIAKAFNAPKSAAQAA